MQTGIQSSSKHTMALTHTTVCAKVFSCLCLKYVISRTELKYFAQ